MTAKAIPKRHQPSFFLQRVILFLGSVGLALLPSCAPPPKALPTLPPPMEEIEVSLQTAQANLERGCYLWFREALKILDPLIVRTTAWPDLKSKVLPVYFKCVLLLGIREKELGLSTRTLDSLASLVTQNEEVAAMAELYEIARAMPVQGKGVMAFNDQIFDSRPKTTDWKKEKIDWERLLAERAEKEKNLEKRARQDEMAAYFWLVSFLNLSGTGESQLKPQELLTLYPRSRLIWFKLAITSAPVPRSDLLEKLLEEEPEFSEAHYFLGEVAMRRGQLLLAEKHYLEAKRAIPESPLIAISLASVYFHLEEFEKSLEAYETALTFLPGYREAMLGRAICLSYLARHEEAIKALQEMIDLGYWLMGEAHFWMAWNLASLNQFQEAWAHCQEAKGRLPTSAQVFSLSGTVALELNDLVAAEENFLRALEFDNSNAEALVGLGRLEARRENWSQAGGYYEAARKVYETEEAQVKARISEVEASEMTIARKQALLKRKRFQLEKITLSKVTVLFNAASCYYNAGQTDMALHLAEEAASHPAFKEKGADLIARIRKEIKFVAKLIIRGRKRNILEF